MMTSDQQLKEIIETAYSKLSLLSEADVSNKPTPKKWSKKEILGHLIDSCHNNQRRFILATHQDDLVFDGYIQDQWVIVNNYQNRPWSEVLEIWKWSHIQLIAIIQSLPSELKQKKTTKHNFDKISMKPLEPNQETSLDYLISDYVYHVEHHLNQILN